MQDNGLTDGSAGGNEAGAEGEEGEEGKRKKSASNKKQKAKAKDHAEFDAWCKKVLADSAYLLDGVSDEKKMAMPIEFRGYDFSGSLRPAFVTPQVKAPHTPPHTSPVSEMLLMSQYLETLCPWCVHASPSAPVRPSASVSGIGTCVVNKSVVGCQNNPPRLFKP